MTAIMPNKINGEELTWYIKNQSVASLSQSRFLMKFSSMSFEWHSTLQIKATQAKDEGEISCFVANQSDSGGFSMLYVIKPKLDLIPPKYVVTKFGQASLKCVINGMRGYMKLNFTWCRDGHILSRSADAKNEERFTDGKEIVKSYSTHEELLLRSVTSSHKYSCGIFNVTPACVASAQLIVSDQVVAHCLKDTDYGGTQWNPVPINETAIVSCPVGYVGEVTRKCVKDSETLGRWLFPNYKECKNKALTKLTDEVVFLENNTAYKSLTPILEALSEITKSVIIPSEGDLIAMSTLLVNISDIAGVITLNNIDVQLFADIVNSVMDKDKISTWQKINKNENPTSGFVMRSMTVFSKHVIKTLPENKSFAIKKENIEWKMSKEVVNDIKFPQLNEHKSFLYIHKSAIEKEFKENIISYSAVMYKSLDKMLSGPKSSKKNLLKINSPILAIDFPEKDYLSMNPAINITFEKTGTHTGQAVCSYWVFKNYLKSKGRWLSKGCWKTFENKSFIGCACDHLTNFGVLMHPNKISNVNKKVLGLISNIGISISLLCTLATIFVYFYLWKYIKSDRNVLLLNLCVALTIAYVIFLFGIERTEERTVCTIIAMMLHYFFLAVFFLMLAEALNLLVSILYIVALPNKLIVLLSCGWGVPFVIVAISALATELHGYGNKMHCWVNTKGGVFYAFVAPAVMVILVNYVVVILAMKALFSTKAMMSKSRKKKLRAGVRSIGILSPTLGLTWLFGVFSINNNIVTFQYLFAILNSLQGFFIFVIECALNTIIIKGFHNKMSGYKASQFNSSGYRKSKSTTGSDKMPGTHEGFSTDYGHDIEVDFHESKLTNKSASLTRGSTSSMLNTEDNKDTENKTENNGITAETSKKTKKNSDKNASITEISKETKDKNARITEISKNTKDNSDNIPEISKNPKDNNDNNS